MGYSGKREGQRMTFKSWGMGEEDEQVNETEMEALVRRKTKRLWPRNQVKEVSQGRGSNQLCLLLVSQVGQEFGIDLWTYYYIVVIKERNLVAVVMVVVIQTRVNWIENGRRGSGHIEVCWGVLLWRELKFKKNK